MMIWQDNNEVLPTGSKVEGTYYGVEFTGTITGNRAHSVNGLIECTIATDSPVTVFGDTRSLLLIGGSKREFQNHTMRTR